MYQIISIDGDTALIERAAEHFDFHDGLIRSRFDQEDAAPGCVREEIDLEDALYEVGAVDVRACHYCEFVDCHCCPCGSSVAHICAEVA